MSGNSIDSKDACDPFAPEDLLKRDVPEGWDRRAFLMRTALATSIAALTGNAIPASAQTPPAAPAAKPNGTKLSPDLALNKSSKGPVMTVVDEMYKVGPGPSSSHTIGPMRITYDFYQRCTKLPAEQLDQATALKVHLYGSLSA